MIRLFVVSLVISAVPVIPVLGMIWFLVIQPGLH
jgi:hypothetical protein